MMRFIRVAVVVLSAVAVCADWTFAEDRPSTRLEREYARESNPKKRVKLAMQLVEERLKQVRSAYEAEETARQKQEVGKYLSAIELLGSDVREAANTGLSKNAETHLRRQVRELENLKMNVSALDRPDLEKIVTRIASLRQEILYSIMNPRRESATK